MYSDNTSYNTLAMYTLLSAFTVRDLNFAALFISSLHPSFNVCHDQWIALFSCFSNVIEQDLALPVLNGLSVHCCPLMRRGNMRSCITFSFTAIIF